MDRVRHFLRRRHKIGSRGGTIFSGEVVFGKLGVLRLRIYLGAFLRTLCDEVLSESRML